MSQNRTAEATINLVIKSGKITTDILRQAIQAYLDGDFKKLGRVSLRELAKDGKIEGIEVSRQNIADFQKTAARYNVTYALTKNPGNSTYNVLFSASKAANIERAFREYASVKSKSAEKQPFCRESQREFRKRAEALSAKSSQKNMSIEKKQEKVIER